MLRHYILRLLLVFLSGCSFHPMYDQMKSSCQIMSEAPYFLVLLVEARHLDYASPRSFFKTVAKHPSDGSKNGDVGHAWIYLQGIVDGQTVFLEGGHSGELGEIQPRYVEGVFLQYEQGDKNPISYLWQRQRDGFFQSGSGRHYPTFAAKVDISAEQFQRILRFIQSYDYADYAITGNQCSSFAAQVAAFAGLELDCELTMEVDQYLLLGSQKINLWQDPVYSEITFSSPDVLEYSLKQAVAEGRAQYALEWYCKTHPRRKTLCWQELMRCPERYFRFKSL